jgi:long-chain acyl-CoA synthetase
MARRMANGLKSLGLPPGSHIGMVSKNCREWIIADLAIMMAGFVSVPFFPTLRSDQLREVLELGDVAALFVGKLDNWEEMRHGVPAGMPIIAFPYYPGNSLVEEGEQWHDFLGRFEPMAESPEPDLDDLWTIIFTSGTTGTPKGVMLSYRKPMLLMDMERNNNLLKLFEGESHLFSYLPLNHIAERAITEAASLICGATISFVENLDTFAKNLQSVQPTLFFAVPRIWTKFHLTILEKMPPAKLNRLLRIPILSTIVKRKIRKALGLSRARVKITAAAPMPDSLKEWYKKLGINLQEIYGLTETCGGLTMTHLNDLKPGTVGKPLPGVELSIDPESGEALARGPWFMDGYYKSSEKTAEVFHEGWFRTGDQGTIDEEGYLKLTGRVSEIFKTAKGKFVVPAPLEWEFAKNSDIEQICVTGLGLPQPVALVVLSELGRLKDRADVEQSLRNALQEVNRQLANYEKIATMIITKEPWTVENGLLTPTLKVKRPVLNNRYGDRLESWVGRPDEIVWEE